MRSLDTTDGAPASKYPILSRIQNNGDTPRSLKAVKIYPVSDYFKKMQPQRKRNVNILIQIKLKESLFNKVKSKADYKRC